MGTGSNGAYAMSGSGAVGSAIGPSANQLTGTTLTSGTGTYRIGLRSDHVTAPAVTQNDQPTVAS